MPSTRSDAEVADGFGEDALIADHFRPLVDWPGAFSLSDDCAEVLPAPGHALIVKTDPVRAGVHFFADDDPADIAWKALAVNVSDLAAKASRPLGYMLALSFPDVPEAGWLRRFSQGLGEAQAAFGLTLIGGDTDRAPGPVSIAVTVFGEARAGTMVRRATARPGDLIYVSGTLGAAAIGLRVRLSEAGQAGDGGLPSGSFATTARQRYLRPQPRLGLRAALRRCASAAMDLSDGLAKDLGRMCSASGCGAQLQVDAIPAATELQAADLGRDALLQLMIGHGDDYEILAAVPPERAATFEALASAGGVGVTKIGQFSMAPGVRLESASPLPEGLAGQGYDHFRSR